MPVETNFYFEIHEDVGLAKNANGEAVKAYIAVSLEFSEPMQEELYNSTHKELVSYLAHEELGILPNHIRPINRGYYEAQTSDGVGYGLA